MEPWERPLTETPSWPVSSGLARGLTLLLAVCLLVPAAAAGRLHRDQWLMLLLPTLVLAISTRMMFEVLGFAREARGVRGHLVAAVPPALIATCLAGAACAIVGGHWSPLTGAGTALACLLTLGIAWGLRCLEIRLGHRTRRVYFVGSPDALRDLKRELARHADRQLVGFAAIDADAGVVELERLATDVSAVRATVLVIGAEALSVEGVAAAAAGLASSDLRVHDLVSFYEREFRTVPLGELSSPHERAPRRTYAGLYRACEIAFAAVLLAATLPLMLILGLVIRLTSPGAALYRQRRVGKGGAIFTLLKLRTMTEATEDTAAWAPSQEHRVTWIGRRLRRFHIDELPQLWNVLRGDLALVGPRPEQVPIVARLERQLPGYSTRHCVRPGITGWAQVSLGYGGSHDGTLVKLQRDLYYVRHCGPRLDAQIIWLTVKAVLAGRG